MRLVLRALLRPLKASGGPAKTSTAGASTTPARLPALGTPAPAQSAAKTGEARPQPARSSDARLASLRALAVSAAIIACLFWLAGTQSYLLFHSLAEAFGVAVAGAMFAVAWNSRRFSSNGYLTFIGIAYLFVGGIDLVHALAYEGMGVFPGHGSNLPTQLWVAARGVEAVSLLLSPLFLYRRVRAWPTLLAYLALTVVLLVVILPLHAFPTCYVEAGPRMGLTPFKIAAEYVICAILLASLAAIWIAGRSRLATGILKLMTAAIVVSMFSELAFTRYVSVYGNFNIAGHLLKAASFILFFKATVEATLKTPYKALFNDLEQREQALRRSEQRYRSLVEMAPSALLVVRNTDVTFANPAAVLLFGGSSVGDLAGKSALDLFHAEHHNAMRQRNAALLSGASVPTVETRIVRLDGGVVDVEVVSSHFDDEEGRAIQVVLRDITEARRARESLEQSHDRLIEANRIKDEFLATLSHELRTPLNAVVGWSQMLLQGHLDEAASRRALEVIDRNARSQIALINDVLDVSRIIGGKLHLDVRPMDVVESLHHALDSIRPAAEARQIEIHSMIEGAGVIVGDHDRIQQVLWNLLSNAVKFTPPHGRVDISVRREGRDVEIRVRDTGIGIAPEALPHLFERFWQADRSTTRQYGGLGLGLAIVRHLVELHGGRVWAESAGEGHGTTVIMRIPARFAPGSREQVRLAHEPGAVLPAPFASSLAGLRVLVLDDEEDTRELLQRQLGGCGAEVRAAATVADALRDVRAWRPDVVISDIGMPGTDGYQFISMMRALGIDQGGLTPAIALTAYGGDSDRQRALAAGFADHLTKPIALAEVASAVAAAARARPTS